MTAGPRHGFLIVLSAILAIWVVLAFFQGAYFGALFYGVQVPVFAAWVGQLPIWSFNVIDTFMLVVLILYLFISSRPTRRRMSQRGAVGGAFLALLGVLGIAIVLAWLATHGVTLAGLWSGLRGFFGT